MHYHEAAAFVMPLGKNQGRALDDIASTDAGLLYLDWMRGERRGRSDPMDRALAAYLDDPTIAEALSRLTRSR